jgi:hypothetical protein
MMMTLPVPGVLITGTREKQKWLVKASKMRIQHREEKSLSLLWISSQQE